MSLKGNEYSSLMMLMKIITLETLVFYSNEVDPMFEKLPNCKAETCDFNSFSNFSKMFLPRRSILLTLLGEFCSDFWQILKCFSRIYLPWSHEFGALEKILENSSYKKKTCWTTEGIFKKNESTFSCN